MNLVIDQGNSFLKYAVCDRDTIVVNGQLDRSLANVVISELVKNYNIKRCIISHTSLPSESLINVLEKLPVFITLDNSTPLPIKIDYSTPSTLGRDRVAGAVACYKMFPNQNSLFIDMGTCITKNIVTAAGVFLGGNISPGIEMRLKAMNYFTERLPLVELIVPENMIGKSTEEALQNGAIRGAVEEIERFIELQNTQYAIINVILTGGNAHFFANLSNIQIFAVPFLVLTGLNEILKYNA